MSNVIFHDYTECDDERDDYYTGQWFVEKIMRPMLEHAEPNLICDFHPPEMSWMDSVGTNIDIFLDGPNNWQELFRVNVQWHDTRRRRRTRR